MAHHGTRSAAEVTHFPADPRAFGEKDRMERLLLRTTRESEVEMRGVIVCLGVLACCVGCSDNGASSPSPDQTGAIVGDGEIAGARGAEGDFGGEASGAPSSPGSGAGVGDSAGGGGSGQVGAGILTAGAWDDNRNFDLFMGYRAKVQQAGTAGILPLTDAEHLAGRAAAVTAHQTLDVSLVIDTTGSMGDEITYLQREFVALASTIQTKFPGSDQHWSLVLYKDTSDEYVVRWYDFRATPGEFKEKLALASSGGGGDMPEAPDQALAVAHRLSWRSAPSTAKLMFWVADAPHHAENAERLANALRGARDKGIHVYPVASSGIDELTELTMRSAAQVTGGRYLFLTDDSGVGGTHKEASVPCYFVTKLDQSILRMIDIEMTGQYREPAAAEVLRTGGNPASGLCTLNEGQTAAVY